MPTEPRLENYLSRLDRSLGAIPVSDRADIVTEIRSHVLEAQSRDSGLDLSKILGSLGEPETVANRYLLERGLKPGKPSRSPMVKWLTIGFLGTAGILCLFVLVLIFKFSPVIQIDEANERVVILGGLIDVDGKKGNVKIGSTHIQADQAAGRFAGSTRLPKNRGVEVPFLNGNFEIGNSTDDTFRWKCAASGKIDQGKFEEEKDRYILDLRKLKGIQCGLEVPAEARIKLEGSNVQMNIVAPRFDLDAQADNGSVEFTADSRTAYRFDVSTVNGKADAFESSGDPRARTIRIKLTNGAISKN